MSTKTPSSVKPSPEQSLEKTAYECVTGIPTVEPHDRDRLGYNIYLWLKHRRDPLDVVLKGAGARYLIKEEEAVQRITDALKSRGISL